MSLIQEDEMPATRLELRWTKSDDPEWPDYCEYSLILELYELDVRGEVYDDEFNVIERQRFKKLGLGGTRSRRGVSPLDRLTGEIDTPFRDGAHIKWDAIRLGRGVPAFAVCDGWAMPISLEGAKLPEGEA